MAASVSHEMRRHPAGPSEPPAYMITSNDQIHSPSYSATGSGGGGLSQSMRYAESWLYGAGPPGGGIPLQPAGLILPYPTGTGATQPLVILCSCSGTKRSKKTSPSVCKKCKGTRLPLNGGTVKLSPQKNGIPIVTGTIRGSPNSFGTSNSRAYHTVREKGAVNLFTGKSNVSKLRPTIFDLGSDSETSDPYDLMRRSRLVSPNETRTRTKSISPTRGRSRRPRSPSPRSRSVNRDVWVDDTSAVSNNLRRSILECDVNPYELMGSRDVLSHGLEDDHNSYGIKIQPKKEAKLFQDSYYEDIDIIEGVKNNIGNKDNSRKKYHTITFKDYASKPERFEEKNSDPKTIRFHRDYSVRKIANQQIEKQPERPPRKSTHKINENETNQDLATKFEPSGNNKFKSILKKSSTFDSDIDINDNKIINASRCTNTTTDRNHSSRSPQNASPQPKNGSQFYIPSPIKRTPTFVDTKTKETANKKNTKNNNSGSVPRKKVQFLVENIEICNGNILPNVDKEGDTEIVVIEEDEININNDCEDDGGNRGPVAVEQYSVTTGETKSSTSSDCFKDFNNGGAPKLRRSFSDRAPETSSHDSVRVTSSSAVTFHDTMALRTKKTDNREKVFNVFRSPDRKNVSVEDANVSVSSQRPKEPPPPPPSAPVAPARKRSQEERRKKSLVVLQNQYKPDEEQTKFEGTDSVENLKPLPPLEEMTENEQNIVTEIAVDSESKPENVTVTNVQSVSNIAVDSDASSTVSIDSRTSSQISIRLNSTENHINVKIDNNSSEIATPSQKNDSKNIIRISNSENTEPMNISSVKLNGDNTEPSSKTVVEISPSVVHRLKIKNESVSETENQQRKTSILINGDDCYSTVNVNDDVPLYQSSVVVNDGTDKTLYSGSTGSTVYITCDAYNSSAKELSDSACLIISNENDPVDNSNAIDDPNEQSKEDDELNRLLRDPVEAVKRNLVPHVCGKTNMSRGPTKQVSDFENSVIAKLLKDPELGSLVEGLESEVIAKLLQESLLKLKESRTKIDEKDSLCSDGESNVNSLNSGPYEQIDNCMDDADYSGSNRSSVTEDDLASNSMRSKFYQLLADAALDSDDHAYESIRLNQDPIYEEIEIPPPLPLNPPPDTLPSESLELDASLTTRSIFEGASKYDILSYLVDARERGIESYAFSFANSGNVVVECENENLSTVDELTSSKCSVEVERTDSGVGSESSKSSRSRYQQNNNSNDSSESTNPCEDCNAQVDTQVSSNCGVVYTPLVCRKCAKRRTERKEIITEIVETEEKYARDLQIILEEFYQPMLVAGLLTAEQLSAVFLNVEELLENSQSFGERLRDALEIAVEQGDEDLLTVDVGRLFLDASSMLHAFENYCVRQAAAGLLLANLEKEKELLRIFLKVSQMENAVLRRMNLNSFLMVPVQRVTKYPLLLARLNKVTPLHLDEMKESLNEAQKLVEQHLGQMNASAKDVPSRLWRRLSSGRRTALELDSINIKLRKLAVDILEWNHEEARFALEGKLLYTQPIDSAWRRGRTIKLSPVCALLVTLGRPGAGYKSPDEDTLLAFPRQTGIREAALVLARDKGGRYSLLREPLYLDRCIIAADQAWQSYFEVQELMSKDTFIFKAEDDTRTLTWYRHLQYHAQGMGTWRKRRNALANIMISSK